MFKGNKSNFYYSALSPLTENIRVEANKLVVVDRGYLLHKLVWHHIDSVRNIVARYFSYTGNHRFRQNLLVVYYKVPDTLQGTAG